jgi:large subunit ribosomal protein L6
MSRIGKKPIPLPDGVEVTVKDDTLTVQGPKGRLQRSLPDRVEVAVEERVVTLTRKDDARESRALHGLSRALVANMVTGVAEGFRKELSIVGVGYRASLKGSNLEMQLGFSHPVTVAAPEGVAFEVPEPTRVIVSGIDKERVGQVAADIRKLRPPEPYKGKGVRYIDEQVRRKAGKAGKR